MKKNNKIIYEQVDDEYDNDRLEISRILWESQADVEHLKAILEKYNFTIEEKRVVNKWLDEMKDLFIEIDLINNG